MIYSSSAPGSLMLFGEHVVLRGGQALCAAVNQRIRVNLIPRADREIHLYSSALGRHLVSLDNLLVQPPFEFVLTAVKHFYSQLPSGFNLEINAEFSSTMGLGSSSAVTVATLAVMADWLKLSLSPLELFQAAKAVVVNVQGVGSGADVAAAIYGGVVAFKTEPLVITPILSIPEIILVYSGAKVPTRTVIRLVAEKQQDDPERYQQLFTALDQCAQSAITALQTQNWRQLGELMLQHQQLQVDLGVSTPLLDELVTQLCVQTNIYGAKISGSGLGDCVLGLGTLTENLFPQTPAQQAVGVKQIPVKISAQGYKIECQPVNL